MSKHETDEGVRCISCWSSKSWSSSPNSSAIVLTLFPVLYLFRIIFCNTVVRRVPLVLYEGCWFCFLILFLRLFTVTPQHDDIPGNSVSLVELHRFEWLFTNIYRCCFSMTISMNWEPLAHTLSMKPVSPELCFRKSTRFLLFIILFINRSTIHTCIVMFVVCIVVPLSLASMLKMFAILSLIVEYSPLECMYCYWYCYYVFVSFYVVCLGSVREVAMMSMFVVCVMLTEIHYWLMGNMDDILWYCSLFSFCFSEWECWIKNIVRLTNRKFFYANGQNPFVYSQLNGTWSPFYRKLLLPKGMTKPAVRCHNISYQEYCIQNARSPAKWSRCLCRTIENFWQHLLSMPWNESKIPSNHRSPDAPQANKVDLGHFIIRIRTLDSSQ